MKLQILDQTIDLDLVDNYHANYESGVMTLYINEQEHTYQMTSKVMNRVVDYLDENRIVKAVPEVAVGA